MSRKDRKLEERLERSKKITRERLTIAIDEMIQVSDNEDFIREIDKIAYETIFSPIGMLRMRAQRLLSIINIYYPNQETDSIDETIHYIYEKRVGQAWKGKED